MCIIQNDRSLWWALSLVESFLGLLWGLLEGPIPGPHALHGPLGPPEGPILRPNAPYTRKVPHMTLRWNRYRT